MVLSRAKKTISPARCPGRVCILFLGYSRRGVPGPAIIDASLPRFRTPCAAGSVVAMDDRRQRFGAGGEEAAERFLRRQRYTILERNYRCPLGEADLIALDR